MPVTGSSPLHKRTPAPNGHAGSVFEQLRHLIVTLDLAPGTTLNRQELQARFGLSSTPLRDALLRLSEEGLVDIVPQSATRVSLIDIAKAREAQFLRRAVEIEVVGAACALQEKHFVHDLREIVGLQRAHAAQSAFEEFDRLDLAFHQRLFEAAGMPDLHALIRRRSGHIDRIRRLHLPMVGKMQDVIRDHDLIVKAIARSRAEDAQFRMRDHLSRSLAYSPTLRERHPSYFTA